jgi:UDP-GlcNAc:undecaprenyl-phosphate GlcNAc-1-phosphate transferase
MNYFLILISSAVVSLLSVILVRKFAIHFKIGSLPSPRKLHKGFVPLLGGLGFLSGIISAIIIAQNLEILPLESITKYKYFWIGLVFILLTGMFDDIKGISSRIKFLGQAAAAILLIIGGCKIQTLSGPMGEVLDLGIFAIPFTFLWIILIINAINLLDGLDGLASGVTFIIMAGLMIISFKINNLFLIILGLGLTGSILGFLKFNYHPASIFMGEVGSLQLGYILAFFSIETMKVAASHHVYFLASLIIFGVPLSDTLVSFLRRLGQGKVPFLADAEHIHHRLLNLGLTHLQTVWLLYIFTAFYAGLGLLMVFHQGIIGLLLFIIGFIYALFWIYRLGYVETRLSWQNLSNQFQRTGVVKSRAPLHFHRIWHILILLISDIFAINIALYLTYWVKFQSGLFAEAYYRPVSEYFSSPVFILLLLGWIFLFYLNNLYRMDWDISRFEKTLRISKVITFGVLFIGLMTLDYQQLVNRSQLLSILSYWIIMLLCVNGGRLLIIIMEKKYKLFEYSPRNALIIGCNEIGRKVLEDIQYNPHLIFNIVGFVSRKAQRTRFRGLPVLGNFTALPKLIHKHKIEEIIIALPEKNSSDFIQILSLCEPQEVKIKIPPGMVEILSGKRPNLVSHGYMQVFAENMVLWQWLIKRLIDITISTLALILISPFLVLSSIILYFLLRKPVLVKIPILGKYGIPFSMYVFRLSPEEYHYEDNPLYLGTADTVNQLKPFMLFLYRYRLYKLPQLFNVILGDMSIVGPRPEPVEWYREFSATPRFLHRRVSIRPGLTGLAQVKYHFELSHKLLQEWIKYDIYYIENMSLRMDLGISIRTMILLILKPYNGVNKIMHLKKNRKIRPQRSQSV